MPAYENTQPPTALYPGTASLVWKNESPITGATSERVAISAPQEGQLSFLRLEIQFSAFPGAFEIDIQTSDTDQDQFYTTELGTSIIGVNTGNVASYMLTFLARFVRLIMTTAPANAVNVTAKISR